jgi:hypothetical protein
MLQDVWLDKCGSEFTPPNCLTKRAKNPQEVLRFERKIGRRDLEVESHLSVFVKPPFPAVVLGLRCMFVDMDWRHRVIDSNIVLYALDLLLVRNVQAIMGTDNTTQVLVGDPIREVAVENVSPLENNAIV